VQRVHHDLFDARVLRQNLVLFLKRIKWDYVISFWLI
jgi:hypothetical protein